jgi:hypothetical protein
MDEIKITNLIATDASEVREFTFFFKDEPF